MKACPHYKIEQYTDILMDLVVIIIIVVFFCTVLYPLTKISRKELQSSVISSTVVSGIPTQSVSGVINNSVIAYTNNCINIPSGTKEIIVSISQQHLWVCTGTTQVYDTAVTTGAYKVAGDETPTGTWKIYAKQTNRYLSGPGYRYFVQYWIPFFGNYGFHDANWQTFPFGSPLYGTEGSHGCVHLPLTAVKWLFDWSSVGTTVMIEK